MRSYGLAAELKEYDVLLPYPKRPSVVELIAPRRERLALSEAVVPEDSSSSNAKIIPLFNGYSPSGDVTAPLVYVNYGLPPDYEALKKAGVDVKGRLRLRATAIPFAESKRGLRNRMVRLGCSSIPIRPTMATCRVTFIPSILASCDFSAKRLGAVPVSVSW